jgi:hypothetical protein
MAYIVEILDHEKNAVCANLYTKAKDIIADFQMLTVYDIYNITSHKNRNIYNKKYKSNLRITKI